MRNNEDLVRLREICDLAHKITKEDKSYIEECANELGVKFEACSRCPNKYRDLAVQLYSAVKATLEPEQLPETESRYQLRPGVDVYFGWEHIRVNEATMTDKLGDYLIKRGFPRRYFVRYPQNED